MKRKITRVLISVSDKTGIVEFARALAKRGVEILSTGGTAKVLENAGVSVLEVSKYTGSPEILDGRLKTLHPKIHGGLLGIRENEKHKKEMMENGIAPIDLLVVNLYPFEETVRKPNCFFEDAIENIDIGGPAMLRAAAKNFADVGVVTDPDDYVMILKEMNDNDGALTDETKFSLAKKVFAHTAHYDSVISNYLNNIPSPLRGEGQGEGDRFSSVLNLTFEKIYDLRYGENPHQKAAFYRDEKVSSEPNLVGAKQQQGKELSYNNIMDADATIEMVKEFTDAPFVCVIVKHANPCGVALSSASVVDAYKKALGCDPTSAFGGIIGVNREIDAECAKLILEIFYEVIVAPSFSKEALQILSKKKNLRLLEVAGLGSGFSSSGLNLRKVTGGLLVQERDLNLEDVRASKVVTKRAPTEKELNALLFAWRVCKHVKSNAIVIASDDRILGIGAGQTSRVDSTKIAVEKAVSRVTSHESRVPAVMASDAFFPFRDGIDIAAGAGVTAIVQPGGSIKDEEVIAAADEHKIAMVFTGVRHFRH